MFVPTGGLPVTGSSIAAADPVVSTSSDHATVTVPLDRLVGSRRPESKARSCGGDARGA